MFINYPIILYTVFIICSSPVHTFIALFWRFFHKFQTILTYFWVILFPDTGKETL